MMRALQVVAVLLVVVLAYGALLSLGHLKATSWLAYIGSLLAGGSLGLLAEGVAGHVLSKDKTCDPPLRRLGRLLLLLGVVLAIGVLINWLLAGR